MLSKKTRFNALRLIRSAGFQPAFRNKNVHIIVYVLDALRADHLGCYGYPRPTSPHIDRIAGDGVRFTNCFSATTWTRPVAASLLTGVYPAVHGTRTRADRFSADLVRLPEVLQAAGYKTAGFSTMGNIAGEIGFAHGFDHYMELFREPSILARRQRLDAVAAALMHTLDDNEVALPLAEDINEFLLPWLQQNRTANTFSLAWSIQPHVPYDPPPGFRRFAPPRPSRSNEGQQDDIRSAGEQDRQRLMDLYDDEIAYNDHCLGELTAGLQALGIYEDVWLILVGDHGEAFYEHGVYAHGHAPFEEVVHVPLIMKLPGQRHAGIVVEGLTELIDILPTLVHGVGLTLDSVAPGHLVQGRDLMPLIRGEKRQVRSYVFSDTQALELHNRYLSVRDDRWKYIRVLTPRRDGRTLLNTWRHVRERRLIGNILRHPRHFWRNYFRRTRDYLFDLQADPHEQDNLAGRRPAQVEAMRQVLDNWLVTNETLAGQVRHRSIGFEESQALRQHLEKLGYL